MNGGTADSSTKITLEDNLYGGSSVCIGNTTNRDTSCSSGDYSPTSSSLCHNNSMLVPSMIPLSHGSRNLVSMSHIFPSFRTSQNKISPSVPGSSHTCRVCAKTFRASSLLDIHMRVHVGAKPFVCPICGHRATQKGNLKLHMKKHHGAELPPHIDLVPDSGIWGHPQENVLCSNTPQQSEGFDNNLDASGKRKQVAQAVSSLLNEEVVELIKKYQNDVGQGTTGTITESLEDFIRIAKNKSCTNSKDSSTVCGKPKKGMADYRKKRLALSLRFQPYPEFITSKKPFIPHSTPNVAKCSTSCAICGKSCRNLPDEKLPVCQECLIVQGYTNSLSSLGVFNKRSSEGMPTQKTEALATINNVSSAELTQKTIPGALSTCNTCGFAFLGVNLERHKEVHHPSKRNVKRNSRKEQFLQNLGLILKQNAASSDENRSRSLSHEEGLNPLLGHVMSRWNLDAPKDGFERCQSAPSEIGRSFTVQESVTKFPAREREDGAPSPIRRRASPGVLKMLRQTLLNSADQKESTRQNLMSQSDDAPACFSKDEEPRGIQSKESCHYRNPAMQSLAEIGKSMIFSGILSSNDILKKKQVNDHMKTSILERQDQESRNGYKCPYCPKWFKYRSVLEIHVRSHTGERPYKCPFCEYAGTQHNCLKLHIQRHHPTKNPYSPGTSVISQNVGVPSRVSIPDPSPVKGSCFSPVNCPVCGRVSPSPGYLKIHMRSHKKSLDHVCHVCGRGFKEYWYLSTHLKTHERELTSLKFNLQQYNARSQSKPSSNAEYFESPLLLNKFAATFANGNDLSVNAGLKPRIIKHEPTSTRHIYVGGEGSQSESEQNNSTMVSKNDGKSNLNEKGVVGLRSRRRKASCPSRVVSSPNVIPRLPNRRSAQFLPSSETFNHEDNVSRNATNWNIFNDESPLDLRCPAKKLRDTTDVDVPMNLCKM